MYIDHLVIQVSIKNVYGCERIYPANATGEKFAELLGVKTFSRKQMKQINALGFTFERVVEELTV